MISIDAAQPISTMRSPSAARQVQADAADFTIPKSPLRHSDDARAKRDESPVKDSVEFTQHPEWLNLPRMYSPPPAVGLSKLYDPAKDSTGSLDEETEQRLTAGSDGSATEPETEGTEGEKEGARPGTPTDAQGRPLDEEAALEVDELKSRDREVRQHEQAHKATGGQYAGAISYEYQRGPDGNRYAVGGEVSIDVSKEKEPEATVAKMRQVRAAALAPAEPSSQDRQVAATATQLEAEARQELAERSQKAQSGGDAGSNGDSDDNGDSEETAAPTASRGTAPPAAGGGNANARLSAYKPSASAPASRLSALAMRTPLDVYA